MERLKLSTWRIWESMKCRKWQQSRSSYDRWLIDVPIKQTKSCGSGIERKNQRSEGL